MSEMKPVAWLADDGCGLLMATIDKSSAYEVCASEIGVGLVSPLYTAEQLAEAMAAERERCLRIVMMEGITPIIPDDPDPVAEAINGALQNVHEAIRSAAK